MKFLLTIAFLAFLANSVGQNLESNKYYFAKAIFQSDIYKPAVHKIFGHAIRKLDNNTYQFGSKTLKVYLEDTDLSIIFNKGIFNPDIIFGITAPLKSKAQLDTMSVTQRVFYNITRNDKLSICCFEQLELLNPNAQTKRFKLWVTITGMLNPTEYYLELKNENATNTTPLKEFLENSSLTFHYKGTIII